MKVGDLVVWQLTHVDMYIGTVLETKPTLPPRGEMPGLAVLAYMPALPDPEQWFHEAELENMNDSA